MAPFSAWLPAHPNQDFDLAVKIVGRSASGLIDELAPIAQALTLHGCQVMVQTGRLNGGSGHLVLRLRIASRPFYSMGHGCDVVVYLDQDPPEFWRFGLQPGSVLVWEPPEQWRLHPLLPDGIIAYPVPLRELNAQYSQGTWGKGFVAMGVLAQLLGFSEEARGVCLKSLSASRLFDSGYQFASRSLVKHDIYSLPLAARGDARIVLSPEKAVKLGFAASHCESGTDCASELERSPTQWIARHLAMADKMVSVLHSEQFPDVQAYRGPQGKVFALFRGDDASILASLNGCSNPRILVAADAVDAVRLLVVGHRLIEANRAGWWESWSKRPSRHVSKVSGSEHWQQPGAGNNRMPQTESTELKKMEPRPCGPSVRGRTTRRWDLSPGGRPKAWFVTHWRSAGISA